MNAKDCARSYLRRLDLADDPQYAEDPVRLLGDTALRYYTLHTGVQPDLPNLPARVTEKGLGRPDPVWDEVARGILFLMGEIYVAPDVNDVQRFKTPHRLEQTQKFKIDQQGPANTLVISGDFPYAPFQHNDVVFRLETKGKICFGSASDWFLVVEISAGIYEVTVRVYPANTSNSPDIIIRLTPKKALQGEPDFVEPA